MNSPMWVFILDPKNFLALIGLWTLIRWVYKFSRWISRKLAPKPKPPANAPLQPPPRAYRTSPENLNKDYL